MSGTTHIFHIGKGGCCCHKRVQQESTHGIGVLSRSCAGNKELLINEEGEELMRQDDEAKHFVIMICSC
jgi:hypothetical protein